jgi:hypothetical protein
MEIKTDTHKRVQKTLSVSPELIRQVRIAAAIASMTAPAMLDVVIREGLEVVNARRATGPAA